MGCPPSLWLGASLSIVQLPNCCGSPQGSWIFPTRVVDLPKGCRSLPKGCGPSQGVWIFPSVVDLSQGLWILPRVVDPPKGCGSSQGLWIFPTTVVDLPNFCGPSQGLQTFPRAVDLPKVYGPSQGLWTFPRLSDLSQEEVDHFLKACGSSQRLCQEEGPGKDFLGPGHPRVTNPPLSSSSQHYPMLTPPPGLAGPLLPPQGSHPTMSQWSCGPTIRASPTHPTRLPSVCPAP